MPSMTLNSGVAPRDGMGMLTQIIHKENATTASLVELFFLLDVYSSKMTLAHFKLTLKLASTLAKFEENTMYC